MGTVVKLDLELDLGGVEKKINRVANDETTMICMQNLIAKMCNPYVPMREGVLSQSEVIESLPLDQPFENKYISISSDCVHYIQPYAHYMYTGDVYGPNIPIIENGIITGWWSPKGEKKKTTGKPLQYNTEKHSKATKKWLEVMVANDGDRLCRQVENILKRRIDEVD
jgi:hypothetical protein